MTARDCEGKREKNVAEACDFFYFMGELLWLSDEIKL